MRRRKGSKDKKGINERKKSLDVLHISNDRDDDDDIDDIYC
jgi:hypothetical protein